MSIAIPGIAIPVVHDEGRWPWVSRLSFRLALESAEGWRMAYEKQLEHNRTLVQTIVELKRENFAPKAAKPEPRQPQPGPLDIEDVARAGAMEEAVSRMTEDFVRNGADAERAQREARKLIGEMHAVYDLD